MSNIKQILTQYNDAIQPGQEVKLQAPVEAEATKAAEVQAAEVAAGEPQEAQKVVDATNAAEATKATEAQAAQVAAAGGVHQVQAGDTFSAIATKSGMSVDQLLAVPGNEQFKSNPDVIQPGQEVKLQAPVESVQIGPIGASSAAPIGSMGSRGEVGSIGPSAVGGGAESIESIGPIGSSGGGEIHTVKVGDTLSQMAHEHHTTVSHLASSNAISNPDHIEVGQDISISGESSHHSGGSSHYP